jgi:spore germination cell wall hydrolase CwlJ-like protein
MAMEHDGIGCGRAAATVDPAERDCLAEAVYFEARSEPRAGRLAVAHVVMNRVGSDRYADDVCQVIRQGEQYGRGKCQFSWRCDGLADIPRNMTAWADARAVAEEVLEGGSPDLTHGALFYHATSVKPAWAPRLRRTARIGQHIYYRDTAG